MAGSDDGLLERQQLVQRAFLEVLRTYNRLTIDGEQTTPAGPVLFVANHGFGGIFDLNVAAAIAALGTLDLGQPVTILAHRLIWDLGLGRIADATGARPASRTSALAALAAGRHVLVFPGGDVDAFKDYRRRNDIVFAGRTGFAELAIRGRVPIVPLVTAGGNGSVISLPGGRQLAAALGADRRMRMKSLPVSVSIPWGLTGGLAGLLPYVPLPVTLRTRVGAPLRRRGPETAGHLANRVQAAMQETLTALTATST